MGLYKFHCEFLVRAKDAEQAKQEVQEEFGDAYEKHIIMDEVIDNKQEVDLDLTKE